MRRTGAYLLGATLLAAAPLAAQDDGQDDAENDGGGFLERTLEDALSGEGRDVSITGFQGALSSTASLQRMTFSDADGVWLRLEDVELVWTRTALLRGRVKVDRLTAAEIEFARPPLPANEMPSAEAPGGFSLPELPVSINIGELSAERLILGAPLIGTAATLSLEAALSLAGGEGSGRIAAERLDGPDGTFVVEANYSNASEVLTLSATVEEAEGGIVATLAGLPGTPALDLDVAGTGPLSDFAADLTLATDGEERVAGTLELLASGPEGADTGFRAELAGDVAPLLFPEYQAFFGPDLSLAVAGAKRGDGSLGIEELALEAAQLRLAGQAEIGADGLPDLIDLTGRIASEDGSPVLLPVSGADTRIDGVDLRVGFDASRSEDWTATIDLRGLSRPGLEARSIALDGTGRIDGSGTPRVTADLDFAATALDLGDAEAQAALGEDVTGRLSVDWTSGAPVEITALTIEGESYGLDGRATLDTSDTGLDITALATVTARDLSVFSGIAGRPLSGSVEADVRAEAAPVAGLYDVTLSATGEGLGTGIAEVDQLLAGRAAIDLAVRRDETGSHIDRFTANTDAARIEATASLSSERGEAQAEATLIRTDVIAPDVPGPLSVRLTAAGPTDVWDILVAAEGPGTRLDGQATVDLSGEVPALVGNVTASLDDIAPYGPRAGRDLAGAASLVASGSMSADLATFDIEARAETTDLAVGMREADAYLRGDATASVTARRIGDTIAIPGFRFESPEARASGSGTLDLAGAAPGFDGSVAASVGDIAPLGGLAGRDLAGAVDVTAEGSLVTDLSAIDLEASLETRDLQTGQPQADQILRGTATASLTVRREGDTLSLPAFRFESPQLTADASGAAETGESLAEIRTGSGTARVTLLSSDGILPGMPVPLTATFDADGTPEGVDVDLAVEGGDTLGLTADARIALAGDAPSVEGTARLRAGDIAPFSALANRQLRGAIDLDAEGSLGFDLEAFDVTASLETRGLSIGQPDVDALLAGTGRATVTARREDGVIDVETLSVETAALTASASGTTGLAQNDARFDLRLANVGRYVPGFSGPATAVGTASQRSGGDWRLEVSATAPGGTRAEISGSAAPGFDRFDIGARGSLPLQAANTFIEPRAVAGTAGFDLRLKGPPALGSLSGTVTTSNARFTAPNFGIVLNRLGATVDIANSGLRVDAGAQIRGGGRVTASGPIGLSAPFPADLDIALQNAVLSDPKLYRTTVNGTVSISGGLAGGARIGGALALGETELRIPSGAAAASGPDFDIRHINEPASVRQTRERAGFTASPEAAAQGGGGPVYPLALTISAPNRIFLRGRGLDAELGGELRVGGTTANVIPTGQFQLIRGRLDILGQRLGFDEGLATLQGNFNPYIRLVAATRQDDTLIRIVVQGLAASPDILFQSEPDLPEDEVLSRLLFGRGVDNLSPLQAAQLAGAVAELAGRRGGGIVSRLRQSAGLDDLDVTGDGQGGVGLRAGKYLSDNIYSDVTIDSTGEAEVSINLDLSESITVKGKLGSTGESGIGVFFERDY